MFIYEVSMSPNEAKNLPVLANAIQLISDIALEVVGNDIAAEVDGVKITQSSVKLLAAASLTKSIMEKGNA
ncbi:hypothetical protein D3C71_1511050 [compost metagenome]